MPPEEITAEDGEVDKVLYLRKDKDGEIIEHFAQAKYVWEGLLFRLTDIVKYYRLAYKLDDKVHENYAEKLIPKTVGYTAGLIDYFFRGKLEIEYPDGFVYAIIDGSVIDGSYEIDGNTIHTQMFKEIKAKVRNITPDEAMQDGQLIAVARYKRRKNYQPDLSTGAPVATSMEYNFSYAVSGPIDIPVLNSGEAQEFTFDFSQNPIPAGITDLYLQVIFKGTLGNEPDTAIAVGMKDINEPMHITIINATDRFYLDGILRTADQIRSDPALLARVDFDGDGIAGEWEAGEPYIDPFDIYAGLGFSEDYQESWTPFYTPLPPGTYGRLILLTDTPQFHMYLRLEAAEPLEFMEGDYLLEGVTDHWVFNAGIAEFENTIVYGFRGIGFHQFVVRVNYYPDTSGIVAAPWPALTLIPITP